MGKVVQGLNLKEEEPRDQDRRVKEDEHATLVDKMLSLGFEEEAERWIGLKRVESLKPWLQGLRGLGRGSEWERERVVDCILTNKVEI